MNKSLRKFLFLCIVTGGGRTKYINKHKNLFHHIGEKLWWQPRKFPDQPELISIGDNVKIAANVTFITHDIFHILFEQDEVEYYIGCIKIGNNVLIGTNTTILPNVRIGDNVVIGAGAVVTKNLESDGVYAGVPAKKIGTFSEFYNKRKNYVRKDISEIWKEFELK